MLRFSFQAICNKICNKSYGSYFKDEDVNPHREIKCVQKETFILFMYYNSFYKEWLYLPGNIQWKKSVNGKGRK